MKKLRITNNELTFLKVLMPGVVDEMNKMLKQIRKLPANDKQRTQFLEAYRRDIPIAKSLLNKVRNCGNNHS